MSRSRSTWTPEQARLMTARAIAARRQQAAERKARAAFQPAPAPAQPPTQTDHDPYVSERISQVREHIARLSDKLNRENDPQRINWLAAAQERLAEQERILAGRPLPGSRRPKPDHAAKPAMPRAIMIAPAPADMLPNPNSGGGDLSPA
jgi:hypothetical protein